MPSLFSFQSVLGTEERFLAFSLHFHKKNEALTLNLTRAVKYFGTAVTAQCPRHVFGGNSQGLNNSTYLLSHRATRVVFFNRYVFVEKNYTYCYYA